MPYTTLFFDLDDTLYPPSAGLWDAIRKRMSEYMIEKLGLSPEQVEVVRQHYLETYGTTLRGLQHFYDIDTEDYLHYVHNLPLADYLRPDPAVRRLILGLRQEKWIFTNADKPHAERVLKVLELEDCFRGVIDVRSIQFHSKPEPEAYMLALQIAGESDPRNCVIIDDSLRNLLPAHRIGFTTVLVNPHPPALTNGSSPHHIISQLAELPMAMPGLWREERHVG